MKIAFVSPFKPSVVSDFLDNKDVPDIHKSSTALSLIVKGLVESGNEVVVYTYCREKRPYTRLEGKGITIHIISSYSCIKGSIIFSRFYMVNRLRDLIEKDIDTIDIIHAHWTYDYALAASHFSSKVPVLCTVRDWCPKIIKMQNNIPMLLYWIVSWCIFKIVMRKKINFVANSDYIRHNVETYLNKSNIPVIYNCIDVNKYKNNSVSTPRNPIFVSISQNADYKLKNIDNLLKAFRIVHSEYPNSVLRLVGRGFEIGSEFYNKWGPTGLLEGVELLGYVDHDQLIELIHGSSCLVHPSLEESFGNTLLEGIACKIPVIGGDKSGAVPYVLGHGEYGILCDVKNPSDIAKAMIRTIEDITMTVKKVNLAYNYLCRNFDMRVIISKHMSLYKKMLNKTHENK